MSSITIIGLPELLIAAAKLVGVFFLGFFILWLSSDDFGDFFHFLKDLFPKSKQLSNEPEIKKAKDVSISDENTHTAKRVKLKKSVNHGLFDNDVSKGGETE